MTTKKPSLSSLRPLRQLGHGSFFEVLLVEDDDGHRFALKRALPDHRNHPGVRRLLHDEGRVTALFTHPHIPRLLAAFDDALVFEVIDGVTLDALLPKKAALPVDDAVFVVRQLLSALAHAHGHGVVHRDVSPHNLMITRSGDAALIDFGIAVDDDRDRWTATGALRGTLGYLSPEAVRGETVDARADVFAATAVFYRLVEGRAAFAGRGARGILDAVAHGRFSAVDDAVRAAVYARGFAAHAEDRFDVDGLDAAVVALADVDEAAARRRFAARVAPLLQPLSDDRGATRT